MPAFSPLGFTAGAYSVTYDAVDIGKTLEGFRTLITPSFIPIRTDFTGRTPVDVLWTGIESILIRIETIEYATTVYEKVYPWLKVVSQGIMPESGMLMTSMFKSLVIAPLTGNASETYTYTKALALAPIEFLLSSQRLRTTPIEFYVIPSAVSAAGEATMYALT